jgi:hypothetical protein
MEVYDLGAVCFDRARPTEVAAVMTGIGEVVAVPAYREWAAMFNTEHEVVAQNSGFCLSVAGASPTLGARVIQTECHQANNMRFHLQRSNGEDGGRGILYALRPVHTDQCLDVSGASTSDGAPVIQWPCSGLVLNPVPGRHPTQISQNQWWWPEYLGDGVVQLVSENSQKCLAVVGGSMADGAGIEQRACNRTLPQQRWRISALAFSDETHALVAEDGSCLSVPSAAEMTAIGFRSCNSSDNQQWRLEPVPQRFNAFLSAITGFEQALMRTPDGLFQFPWRVTFDQQWRMEWHRWGYALRSRMNDRLCLQKIPGGRSVAEIPCADNRQGTPIRDQRWLVR